MTIDPLYTNPIARTLTIILCFTPKSLKYYYLVRHPYQTIKVLPTLIHQHKVHPRPSEQMPSWLQYKLHS